jgi:hypothetical protein
VTWPDDELSARYLPDVTSVILFVDGTVMIPG